MHYIQISKIKIKRYVLNEIKNNIERINSPKIIPLTIKEKKTIN
jgi:hypothetical protein